MSNKYSCLAQIVGVTKFLKVRDNYNVICGNDQCIEPNKKILYKHYEDHMISCLKKNKCPNGCGFEIKSADNAKVHFAECKKCKVCF